MWREITYSTLAYLERNHGGIILVPMTVTEPLYYWETVGRLRKEGMEGIPLPCSRPKKPCRKGCGEEGTAPAPGRTARLAAAWKRWRASCSRDIWRQMG